jgi:hypothetical protein
MPRIAGRNGALYAAVTSAGVAEPIAFLNNWTLSAKSNRTDVTAFGDTSMVYVQGLPDAQGTYKGFYDNATPQTYTAASDGVSRKIYLYPDRSQVGVYWFGTAFFDYDIDTAADGAVQISGSWAAASPIQRVG